MAQKYLNYEQIGKKHFNPLKMKPYDKYLLEIWPGYTTSVNLIQNNIFVMVDLSYKCVRKVTALQAIKELPFSGDREKIRDALRGQTVMTIYNKKFYQITDLVFDMNVQSTFPQRKKGGEVQDVSFLEYHKEKWKFDVKDMTQPLLKTEDKKNGKVNEINQEIYLIPEACFVTGMTDKMRADFHLNKDIAQTTKCPAGERMKET